MKKLKLFALSCNWPTPETSKRKSININSTKHSSIRLKSGNPWFKWPKVSRLSMRFKSCIEISSALMFFAQRTGNTNSGILTFPKLPREEWPELKLVRLITPVLKCGMTDHMIPSVISGHWDALFMKWLHLIHLSEQITWNNCIKKFKRVSTQTFHLSIQKIWSTLSVSVSR